MSYPAPAARGAYTRLEVYEVARAQQVGGAWGLHFYSAFQVLQDDPTGSVVLAKYLAGLQHTRMTSSWFAPRRANVLLRPCYEPSGGMLTTQPDRAGVRAMAIFFRGATPIGCVPAEGSWRNSA